MVIFNTYHFRIELLISANDLAPPSADVPQVGEVRLGDKIILVQLAQIPGIM
jgi:hypothetical protein